MFYFLTVIKAYITVIFLASVVVVILFRFSLAIKNLALRIGAIILFISLALFILLLVDTDAYINRMITSSYAQIEVFKNAYEAVEDFEGSKAGFSIGDVNPTLGSLILKSPEVIFSCMFRPYLWESRKVIILFAALETFLVFLATLFVLVKTKFLGFFYYIFNDPIRLFCFVFSMLFALLIGYTTFNFGAMVRYKIVFLPFYFFLLINILTAVEQKKKSVIAEKIAAQ